MAEYLLKDYLKQKNREYIRVCSAGTAAFDGDSISFYSLQALQERGIDASMHRSCGITQELLTTSDYVFAMTASQKDYLFAYCPKEKLYCIRELLGEDIADPYGGNAALYNKCAEQLEQAIHLIYDKFLCKESAEMKIPIASDHAAFEAKAAVIEYLKQQGYEPIDMGCYSAESVNYPEYGAKVAAAVSSGEYARGILLCGTGIGMSLVANKFPNVRAALCYNAFTAQACREHNDANILVMGARVLSEEQILQITELWLNTPFAGGRHAARLDMIKAIEKGNFK